MLLSKMDKWLLKSGADFTMPFFFLGMLGSVFYLLGVLGLGLVWWPLLIFVGFFALAISSFFYMSSVSQRASVYAREKALAERQIYPSALDWVSANAWHRYNYPDDLRWVLDGCPAEAPVRARDSLLGSLDSPQVFEANEADRSRAPILPLPNNAIAAATGSLDEHRGRLETTLSPDGEFFLSYPTWPICCDRLTMLDPEIVEGTALYHLEAEVRWGWNVKNEAEILASSQAPVVDFEVDGILSFQCLACGRAYAGSCHP